MKQKILIIPLMAVSLSSCLSGGSSSGSSSSSSSWTNTYEDTYSESSSSQGRVFDIPLNDGRGRILSKYEAERTFSQTDPVLFSGPLLNPENYKEDKEKEVWYRTEEAEPGDYSSEELSFSSFDSSLLDLIASYPDGSLGEAEIRGILGILDTNDDIINKVSIGYDELILYNDVFNGEYYAYNNHLRHEESEITRYSDFIKSGITEGNVLYADGFYEEFTAVNQTYGTDSHIIAMLDETFPYGSTTAADYKTITVRTPGNLKKALTAGGGVQAKWWLEKHFAEYDEKKLTNSNYSYDMNGSKSDDTAVIGFRFRISQHIDESQTKQWEMDIDYGITITGGVITGISIVQQYWDIG